jgi:hypothetical protein
LIKYTDLLDHLPFRLELAPNFFICLLACELGAEEDLTS